MWRCTSMHSTLYWGGQPYVSIALTQGNCPRFPINMRLGRSQIRSGCFGEEKLVLLLQEMEPDPSAVLSVALSVHLLNCSVSVLISYMVKCFCVTFFCISFFRLVLPSSVGRHLCCFSLWVIVTVRNPLSAFLRTKRKWRRTLLKWTRLGMAIFDDLRGS
jgi:hypothetical protein